MNVTAPGDGSDPDRDSSDRSSRDRNTVIACFATGAYLALVVCAFGFVSLLADVDVVSRAGTGALIGPAAVAAAVVTVLVALVRDARRRRGAAARPASWPLLVAIGATTAYVAVGAVLVAGESGSFITGIAFAGSTLASAFPYLVGVLAGLVAVVFGAVTVSGDATTPRWPWERDEEE